MKILIALLLIAAPAVAQTQSQKLVKQLRALNAEQTSEIADLHGKMASTEMALLDSQASTVEAKAETAKVQAAADEQREHLAKAQEDARQYWTQLQGEKTARQHFEGKYHGLKVLASGAVAAVVAFVILLLILKFAGLALNTLPGIAVAAGVPLAAFATVFGVLYALL